MIEFVLVFMMGLRVVDQTQTFDDIDACTLQRDYTSNLRFQNRKDLI